MGFKAAQVTGDDAKVEKPGLSIGGSVSRGVLAGGNIHVGGNINVTGGL